MPGKLMNWHTHVDGDNIRGAMEDFRGDLLYDRGRVQQPDS